MEANRPPAVLPAPLETPSLRPPMAETTPPRLDRQVTANAGLHYCCYRLSLLGWNVMVTARNARGVDIVAYRHDATQFLGIQVKSLSKRDAVPLGSSLDGVMGDFWVIVTEVAASAPSTFVLIPSEVHALARRDRRGTFWLERKAYEADTFREAWHRIGRGDR
jgi:hypothetical protein